MLALESKATLSGWDSHPVQLKVADLEEFSKNVRPVERMLLDLRHSPKGVEMTNLSALPWAGFLVDDDKQVPEDRPWIRMHGDPRVARPGDVLEVQPFSGKVAVRYRRGAKGNILFATERCNSYCLMCSQPPRDVNDEWRLAQLCDLVDLIDREEKDLAISGGEPTLLGAGLAHLISRCGQQLPTTRLHVLSNGRSFADSDYAATFRSIHPALSWGIPLYGDHYGLHDYVVQRVGAFAETLRGLYALEQAGQRIEVRVVLVRPTVERISALARFIYRNLPFVEHVALMGVEPIGFAKANYDALWMDPADVGAALEDAVEFLAERGVAVSIYNLPLCVLPTSLWPFAQRSISDWKQDYLPECEPCLLKTRCAGFFSWTNDRWKGRSIRPVLSEVTA